ncbi:MAG: hypothetical protein GSR80_000903 [Desulfurococcales archaeon]|nr:hypothetical protein [Desulfurococcales archaeon]
MGSGEYGVGRILVVCARCGFKLYDYALGDPNNRSKYSGPPTPAQALSGHDKHRCPSCDRPLSVDKPLEIEILTRAEFEVKYIETRFKIFERQKLAERITAHAGVEAYTGLAEEEALTPA